MNQRAYLIIGTGPAGVAAAEAIRGQDASAEIILIGDEKDGYYSRPGLAYFLTGEVTEQMLFPFNEADFRRLNLARLYGRVHRIDRQGHFVELEDGTRLTYRQLLIATGAQSTRLTLPNAGLEGVVKLDHLEDARQILSLARKSKSAVVVGGGITALELVEGLVARRVKTHYFLRGDRYWGNVLDETESHIVERRLAEHHVQIHYHTELGEILGRDGRLVGVRTKDGQEIACQILAAAIGVRPRRELAAEAGLAVERGIRVDEYLRTSDADIFAAGDAAEVYDPWSGQYILDSLWAPARDQGRIAGLNMTGRGAAYRKEVAFNVTRLANLTTTIIGLVGQGRDSDMVGIARGDSETWRKLPDAIAAQANFKINRLRVLVGERRLVGAVVMGDQTLSPAIQHLVTCQADITPIREQLIQPNPPLDDILAEFWSRFKGGKPIDARR